LKRTLAIAIVCLFAAPAWADDGVTKVFPMTGTRLTKQKSDAPAVLTRAMAKSLAAGVASFPIDDAAGLMGCDLDSMKCLVSVAKSVSATKIVFGTVQGTDRGAIIRVTTFDTAVGEDSERRFVLTGDTSVALAEQLVYVLEHGGNAKTKPEPTEPETPETTKPPIAPPDPDPPAKPTGVTNGTWAIVIGGAAVTAAGAGFLISTNSLRTELGRAPKDTIDEINHVRDIERAGKLRTNIGAGLMVAGGAITTVGIVRMILQKRESRGEHVIDVVPEKGGASVFFTMRLK
jgi:hypothetical protein